MDRLLIAALRKIVRKGSLQVTTHRGDIHQFGDGTGTAIAIQFADVRAQNEFIADPDMRLGELYMNERIVLHQGTIYDLLFVFVDNLSRFRPPVLLRVLDRVRFATRRFRQINFPAQSRRNVSHHYDLDSRLYRLFLDADMQYSCAYFETETATLEEAQLAKKRLICAKLAIGPHHRILDIGCGWGGMARYIAQFTQASEVQGITLSEEQLKVAQARAATAECFLQPEFSLTDYRNVEKQYDRIVSVGMFEHVGVAFYDTFFKKCASLLPDDGAMLLHTIGCNDVPGFVTPWLDKYIFPGGYIPSLSEILPPIERAGLKVADVEVLRGHYPTTLRHWRTRFFAHRDQAHELYDERFCKMWEFYLASAEVAFQCEDLVVFQIVLTKQAGTLPATRSYITDAYAGLRRVDRASLGERPELEGGLR